MESAKSISAKTDYRWPLFDQPVHPPQHARGESLNDENRLRNLNCRDYLTCLEAAAKSNLQELECSKCHLKNDNSYEMDETDYSGLMRLYQRLSAQASRSSRQSSMPN